MEKRFLHINAIIILFTHLVLKIVACKSFSKIFVRYCLNHKALFLSTKARLKIPFLDRPRSVSRAGRPDKE